jgi:hypothetical protein
MNGASCMTAVRPQSCNLFGDEPHRSAIRDQHQALHMKHGEQRAVCDADVCSVGETAADEPVEVLFHRLVEARGQHRLVKTG